MQARVCEKADASDKRTLQEITAGEGSEMKGHILRGRADFIGLTLVRWMRTNQSESGGCREGRLVG